MEQKQEISHVCKLWLGAANAVLYKTLVSSVSNVKVRLVTQQRALGY